MAFPKKDTRPIRVDGGEYLWHLNGNWEKQRAWIVIVAKGDGAGQLLWVDPYHHDILPTQATVRSAIRFGLAHGWMPRMKGRPIRLAFRDGSFVKLPSDTQGWEHHGDIRYLRAADE